MLIRKEHFYLLFVLKNNLAMETMPGATHTRQIQIKLHKSLMNGMAYQMKMDKRNRTRGRVAVPINGTNIVKDLAIIVHQHPNHRK